MVQCPGCHPPLLHVYFLLCNTGKVFFMQRRRDLNLKENQCWSCSNVKFQVLVHWACVLTCPGWCWCCWLCQHRWRSWSEFQSRGRSAEWRHPEGPPDRQNESTPPTWKRARTELCFTFCLLSSLGTWRTNRPSLRELTEMPEENISMRNQRSFKASAAKSIHWF